MIWSILIIAAVVILFILVARRMKTARAVLKEERPDFSPEEITTYGLISQADEAFSKKDFKQAESLYIRAASQDPDNPKIYTRLGAIYLEENNYYDAKDAFLQAVKYESEVPSRRINLGLAYMGLKDYYKAYEEFKLAVQLEPKNKKYRHLLEQAQKRRDREKRRR